MCLCSYVVFFLRLSLSLALIDLILSSGQTKPVKTKYVEFLVFFLVRFSFYHFLLF